MGTHPIFESDFDCLTEWTRVLRNRRMVWCPWSRIRPRRRPQSALNRFHSVYIFVIYFFNSTNEVSNLLRPSDRETLWRLGLRRMQRILQEKHSEERQVHLLLQQ